MIPDGEILPNVILVTLKFVISVDPDTTKLLAVADEHFNPPLTSKLVVGAVVLTPTNDPIGFI